MQEQVKSGYIKSSHAMLELMDRQILRLNGVNNVDVFDEEQIVLQTELGKLEIRGHHLNVTSLDVENGDLQVDGIINSFVYLDEKQSRNKKHRKAAKNKNQDSWADSMLSRLFS